MKIFLKRTIFYIFFSLLISFCSQSYTSSGVSISHESPRQVVQQWINALQKGDADVLLELLDQGSWDKLERNFKLYLQTLKDISDNPDPEIEKMLGLKKKAFLKAFLEWENKAPHPEDRNYTISEVKTGQTTATVTIIGIENGRAYKIYLIKKDEQWFVRAEYLENLSPQQNQKLSDATSSVKKATKP